MKPLLLLFIVLTSCSPKVQDNENHQTLGNVIYGVDNRTPIFNSTENHILEISKSIAVMTYNYKLRNNRADNNYYKYSKTPAFVSYDICQDEPFAHENILGNCTGFLIGENLLMTAGHCISEQESCELISFIFDQITSNGLVKKSNTYQCKKVIQTGVNISKSNLYYQDYTILQIEKKSSAPKRPFLIISDEELIEGDPLYTIGSPFGTPLKVADDAYITSLVSSKGSIVEVAIQAGDEDIYHPLNILDYFMTNLDTFSGNSGSPVISEKTGHVIGLLSSGDDDWDFDDENFCQRSRYKPMSDPGEESVFRILNIQNLNEFLK
jgi:V8-like Glu-specific endopeptidase